MRYYYVPSSYRGRRFGSGLRGGALRGLGFVAGGSLKGGFTSIPVVPSQIAEVASKPEQVAAVQAAETTGQPASIGKQLYGLWGKASDLAKTGWNSFKNLSPTTRTMISLAGINGLTKALSTDTGRNIGRNALNLLHKLEDKGIISGGLDLAGVAIPQLRIPAVALRAMGLGYGRARFRKGSPEAKAFMARLRAMRRGRRKGGMFKGVTHADLQRQLAAAEAAGTDPFTVTDGNRIDHRLSIASARRMLEGFRGMTDFWAGKSKAERSAYIKSHYLRGTTHVPWKNMTASRLFKILNRARHNKYPVRFITRRGTDNFINEWGLLRAQPRDNKAKMFQALLRQMVMTSRLCPKKKIRGAKTKYVNTGTLDDLIAQMDGWDR